MKRLDIIERKIKTAKDLESIVKTMKGLAAVSINQYEHAVDSILSYFHTIEQGLQIILHNQPGLTSIYVSKRGTIDRKSIAVIFGAGQPMCGAFNEVLANYFSSHDQSNVDKIITVGHRILANLEHYGWQTDHSFDMPNTVEKINETVQALVFSLQQWYLDEGYAQVFLFYNHPESNASYKPTMQQLLPIDEQWLQKLANEPWQGTSRPTYTMDSTKLVSALLKQFLFVSIYKGCAASLSAENNSRLAAMQVAEKKITEMINDLTKTYRSQRQVNITEEILDIIASFEVLRGEDSSSREPL